MSEMVITNNKNGFYQLDNRILKIDLINELDKFRVAMYLVQKENFTRIKGELPKGQFYSSLYEISDRLDITKNKATRLLKSLVDDDIITLVKKGTSKNSPSIYRMNSITTDEVINQTMGDTIKPQELPKKSVDDIDFIECQLMEKIDLCSAHGLYIECTDDDVPTLEILQAMDIDILRDSLGVAQSKNNFKIGYILGIYQNKGGTLDKDREKIVGDYVYQKKIEESKKRIALRKALEMGETVEEIVEPIVTNDEIDAPLFEDNTTAPTISKDDLPVKNSDSDDFNFSRDVIGMNTYKKLLNGGIDDVPSVQLAREYAEYHNLDISIFDKVSA